MLLFLLLARPPALADPVDDLVRETMDRQRIAGLSLAVVKEGRVMRTGGYGYANLEWRNPARPDTLYQIGSVTKPLTAQAVLMLADEGKVSLDEAAVLRGIEGRLARFKLPRRVVFVDELPRNAMGKVQKNLLRDRFADLYEA